MTIIIDPQSSGIAGNMIIGALVDLGANPNNLKEIMEKSAEEFGKVEVTFEKVVKHGIDSTFCHVEMIENKPAIPYPEFIAKIESLDLDENVKETSLKVFERIGEAEAKVHGKSLDEIHFHEVGASDAVADVIGSIYAEICDEIKEFIPLIKPEKAAYGAGRKDFDHPNVLRIIKSSDMAESDEIDVIETNIDHLTGEEIGYLFDRLMDEGASDVSITPIIMKKNRQGSLLKVISARKNREHLIDVIFKEVGTLGIRITPNLHRGIAKREFVKKTFNINGKDYEVTFKIAYINGEIISERPEYDDLKRIAEDSGLPLRKVKEMII